MTDAIAWHDDALVLLDQRRLPHAIEYVECRDAVAIAAAIRDMVVRGAPAIGIAAAYGVALSARQHAGSTWLARVVEDIALLRASRPTAVNLSWALEHMGARANALAAHGETAPHAALAAAARELHAADRAANERIGATGAALIAPGSSLLTHCNAGALATAGHGTALGVVRSAWRDGRLASVYATETRPWLQGARLTAWELMQDGIDVTLIADGAAGWLMQQGLVQWVVAGADRIAANGDTANKIGTYALATLARAHGVKFMIAAPLSTIDRDTASGADIPLEHRGPEELTHFAGQPIAAPGVRALNPVFDVTPAHLIDALVTDRGLVERPGRAAIERLFRA